MAIVQCHFKANVQCQLFNFRVTAGVTLFQNRPPREEQREMVGVMCGSG